MNFFRLTRSPPLTLPLIAKLFSLSYPNPGFNSFPPTSSDEVMSLLAFPGLSLVYLSCTCYTFTPGKWLAVVSGPRVGRSQPSAPRFRCFPSSAPSKQVVCCPLFPGPLGLKSCWIFLSGSSCPIF